jgi:hypothetical protein
MTTDQKIIKNRVGLLELANQLGNVSQRNDGEPSRSSNIAMTGA